MAAKKKVTKKKAEPKYVSLADAKSLYDAIKPVEKNYAIVYDSNNSGGGWWLKDKDWEKLEENGWKIWWVKDSRPKRQLDKDGTWLGATATSCGKEFDSIGKGLQEFEEVTGQSVMDEGCNCCGAPHSFRFISKEHSEKDIYAYGENLAGYLYDKVPSSFREALDLLNRGE